MDTVNKKKVVVRLQSGYDLALSLTGTARRPKKSGGKTSSP